MRFADCLISAGLRPRDIVPDGRIRRCSTDEKPGKRNGWYVLRQDNSGSWGDWASGTGGALGHWRDEHANIRQPSAVDLRRAQARRDQERAERLQAMRSARAFWNKARPLNRPHPYIERKGLTPHGCAGLRTHDGLLVVPVWNGDWITSVQTIAADGTKRFYAGAPVESGAYAIQRPRSAVTAFVEGLSTGLAIFQSVRQASVVVCFNAGNLARVAQRLRPTGSVVFCADNDRNTVIRGKPANPGIEFATKAAEPLGAGVAWPEGIEGTDFADYLRENGEGAARRVERMVLAKAKFVMGAPVP